MTSVLPKSCTALARVSTIACGSFNAVAGLPASKGKVKTEKTAGSAKDKGIRVI